MDVFSLERDTNEGYLTKDLRCSTMIAVQAYDEESKCFLCDDRSVGFSFECVPLTGGDDSTKQRVEQFLATVYPPGTTVQFFYFRSPDVERMLYSFENLRDMTGRNDLRGVVRERSEFLRAHTTKHLIGRSFQGGEFDCGIVQVARLIVSVKLPIKDEMPTEAELATAKTWQQKAESSLAGCGFYPRALKAGAYIRVMETILNWSSEAAWRRTHLFEEYDPQVPISEQIFDSTTDVLKVNRSTVKLGEDCWVKVLSPKHLPKSFFFTEAMRYAGNIMGGSDGVRCNYAVVANVYYPEQQPLKSRLEGKRQWTNNLAYGPIQRLNPRIAHMKEDFDALTESMQNGAMPLLMSYSVIVFERGEKEIEQMTALARDYWTMMDFTLMEDQFITLNWFQNCLPLCTDRKAVKPSLRFKTLTTHEIPVLLPIFGDWLGTGTPHLTLISRNGQLMSLSLHDSSTNKNCVIAAESGSGKSFLLNEIIVSYLSEGAQVWVIDAGKSYKKLCESLGGDFMQFAEEAKICLNPFPLIDTFADDAGAGDSMSRWNSEEDAIVNLVAAMASERGQLGEYQLSSLKRIMRALWDEKGAAMTVDDIAERCRADPDQRCRDIATLLFTFTSKGGYGRYFVGDNSIDFKNRFTVLELDELQGRKHLRQVVLLQLIYQIQREMYLGERNRKKLLIIDEAWDLLKEGEISKFMEAGYRKFRKYGGSAIIATQSLNDLYDTTTGRAIAENSATMLLLGQKSETIASMRDQGRLVLSEAQFRLLGTVKSVGGVYSEIFVHSSELGCGVGRLIVSNASKLMYSTTPEDVYAIDQYRQQGMDVMEAITKVCRDRNLDPRG